MPDTWEWALLALAAWRTWYLLAFDAILDRPRASLRRGVFEFVQCPYCLGFWTCLAWVGAWYANEDVTAVAATLFSLSAALVAFDAVMDKLGGE